MSPPISPDLQNLTRSDHNKLQPKKKEHYIVTLFEGLGQPGHFLRHLLHGRQCPPTSSVQLPTEF